MQVSTQNKTILPLNQDETTFRSKNIEFRIATSQGNPLSEGNFKWAMKLAAHQLKGLVTLASSQSEGINFPMAIIVDYKGFQSF